MGFLTENFQIWKLDVNSGLPEPKASSISNIVDCSLSFSLIFLDGPNYHKNIDAYLKSFFAGIVINYEVLKIG